MIDSQLLERFVTGDDPAAFRDLVNRHGPAVLRVCRRHLHDPHAAEDALQATFLVLIRRAPSIQDPERLGRWLVGVARRVALRARRQGALRSERERRWAAMHSETCEQEPPLDDIRRVVREELDRLPETYRQPLALCYFEGLTHEQAADRLGWPVGTVKVRLVRARRQLRDRLDRRGVALSVAFLLLLPRRDAEASLATETVESTVKAMTLARTGEVAALRALYPTACRLAGLARPFGGRFPWGTPLLILLAFLVIGSGGVALAQRARANHDRLAVASARLVKLLTVDCK
jgi:RNA polymerase sigma factor (sigma-70 family)